MKKEIVLVIISLVIIAGATYALLISNDNKDNDQKDPDNECITLSARALHEKMYFNISDEEIEINDEQTQTEISLNKTIITMIYETLEDGACIIIRDNISIITYYEDEDKTVVGFSWYEDQYTKTHVYYSFTGNITDVYEIDDEVKIKLTLKHVATETNNTKYVIDIFEEQWESEQYFIDNVQSILIDSGLKSMSPSLIEKI